MRRLGTPGLPGVGRIGLGQNPTQPASGGGGSDPDFANVVFLTSVEETDGEGDQAYVVDVGGHTLTATEASGGTAEVRGAQKKFGEFSLFAHDEAGIMLSRWGTSVNSTDFDFGAGDFTMECHIQFVTAETTDVPVMSKYVYPNRCFYWTYTSNPGSESFTFLWSTDGTFGGGSVSQSAWPVDTYNTGQWYHMAVCRDGNTVRLFLDGVECSKQGDMTGVTIFAGSHEFELLSLESNGAGLHTTYMDNVRVTKGVARYTENFTPPTEGYPIS